MVEDFARWVYFMEPYSTLCNALLALQLWGIALLAFFSAVFLVASRGKIIKRRQYFKRLGLLLLLASAVFASGVYVHVLRAQAVVMPAAESHLLFAGFVYLHLMVYFFASKTRVVLLYPETFFLFGRWANKKRRARRVADLRAMASRTLSFPKSLLVRAAIVVAIGPYFLFLWLFPAMLADTYEQELRSQAKDAFTFVNQIQRALDDEGVAIAVEGLRGVEPAAIETRHLIAEHILFEGLVSIGLDDPFANAQLADVWLENRFRDPSFSIVLQDYFLFRAKLLAEGASEQGASVPVSRGRTNGLTSP